MKSKISLMLITILFLFSFNLFAYEWAIQGMNDVKSIKFAGDNILGLTNSKNEVFLFDTLKRHPIFTGNKYYLKGVLDYAYDPDSKNAYFLGYSNFNQNLTLLTKNTVNTNIINYNQFSYNNLRGYRFSTSGKYLFITYENYEKFQHEYYLFRNLDKKLIFFYTSMTDFYIEWFSSDDKYCLINYGNNVLQLMSIDETLNKIRDIPFDDKILGIAISDNISYYAYSSYNNTTKKYGISILDIKNDKLLTEINTDQLNLNYLSFSKDSKYLIATDSNYVYKFDILDPTKKESSMLPKSKKYYFDLNTSSKYYTIENNRIFLNDFPSQQIVSEFPYSSYTNFSNDNDPDYLIAEGNNSCYYINKTYEKVTLQNQYNYFKLINPNFAQIGDNNKGNFKLINPKDGSNYPFNSSNVPYLNVYKFDNQYFALTRDMKYATSDIIDLQTNKNLLGLPSVFVIMNDKFPVFYYLEYDPSIFLHTFRDLFSDNNLNIFFDMQLMDKLGFIDNTTFLLKKNSNLTYYNFNTNKTTSKSLNYDNIKYNLPVNFDFFDISKRLFLYKSSNNILKILNFETDMLDSIKIEPEIFSMINDTSKFIIDKNNLFFLLYDGTIVKYKVPIGLISDIAEITNTLDDSQIKIIESPFNDCLKIEINDLIDSDKNQVFIYNIEGNIIFKSYINNKINYIDLSGNPNGIYFVKYKNSLKKCMKININN